MTDSPTDPLSHAISIAATAHYGQADKGGQPYILHPLRLMSKFTGQDERIVAVLHDVVEDSTTYTVEEARNDFGDHIADALDAITKRKNEPYDAYLERVAANPLASSVKLADMEDNCDLSRLGREPTQADLDRVARYLLARGKILLAQGKLDKATVD